MVTMTSQFVAVAVCPRDALSFTCIAIPHVSRDTVLATVAYVKKIVDFHNGSAVSSKDETDEVTAMQRSM